MSLLNTRSRPLHSLKSWALAALFAAAASPAWAAPELSVTAMTEAEGNSGTTDFTFHVTLSTASGTTTTVKYETRVSPDGTAVAGEDYVATSGALTFAPGETDKTFTVPVNGDSLYEADERFRAFIFQASGATIVKSSALATIKNDDAAPTLSVADATVTEGNSGTTNLAFTVTLSAPSGKTTTVKYQTQPASTDTA